MLDKDRNVLFLFILFIILLLGLFIIQTEYHEEAHLEIDKLYGCTDSYIKYGFLHLDGATHSLGCDPKLTKDRNYLHAINEIQGYQYRGILLAILFSSFIISIVLLIRKK